VDQEDLTWDDYTPVPNQPAGWKTGSLRGSQNDYTGAVVLLDYADQPFLITQDPEEHPFGNPQPGWDPVPQAEVRDWMQDYLTVPNEYNGGQSISGYWMEDTHGKISVDLTTFGPYHLTGKVHEYGLAGHAPVAGPGSRCPLGDVCNKDIRQEGGALWKAAEGPAIDTEFDFIFYVTAGHDESSTWQEFGEMTVENREDVPDALGPPGAGGATPPLNNAGEPMPNWSPTRYVPWTSWRAAANHWPNASGGSTTQAESSGQSVFAHEFSHVRSLPDNYNNPFANDARAGAGYWEMMDRGTFNGPGGTHNRWQVPNAGGSGLGPSHMVHFKQDLGVLDPDDQVLLDRAQLANQGIAVTTLQARSSVPDETPVALEVAFNGYTPGKCETGNPDPSFWCPRGTAWNEYTMEVVDRVGNDSFAPGHGVLLAQARPSGIPEEWIIDANPQDINMIDFYRPDGTAVPVVRGDPRQLNDATFHAGTNSGSEFEYVEEYNRLHFYVLDTHRDADGVLYYNVAVRNLDGAGSFQRGVSLGQAQTTVLSPGTTHLQVPLTNTGQAGAGLFDSDIYRISAAVDGAGWDVQLPYVVRAAKAGQTIPVDVYATSAEGAASAATLTITATSEADPTASHTITVPLSSATTTPQDDASPDTATQGPQDSDLTLSVAGRAGRRRLVALLGSADDPGTTIGNRLIRFYTVGGRYLGQRTTGSDGLARLGLPRSFRSRHFRAAFGGDAEWLGASATAGG
jgi:M6 family metalloprotease-like protein